jgi:hypothetical protein
LQYGVLSNKWDIKFLPHIPFDSTASLADWNKICFRLTDLARVEEQAEAPIQPTTDWEAKYNELEKQADQYKSDFENAVKHIQSLSDTHTIEVYDLQVENHKLKNYIINQLLNNETHN